MKRHFSLGLCLTALAVACGDDEGTASSASASASGTTTATGTGGTDTTGTDSQTATSTTTAATDDSATTGVDTGTSTETTTATGDSGDTGSGTTGDTGATGDTTTGGALNCNPGETMCVGQDQQATCLPDGSDFAPPEDCGPSEQCAVNQCTPLCDLIQLSPTSIGCSFLTTKMDNFYNNVGQPAQNDSLIAGNVSGSLTASAQLYYVPINGAAEQAVGAAVQIPPQGTHTWVIDEPEIDSYSVLRTGGVFRLETDVPVVAYRHSPIGSTATNDASMLLPEHALTGNYIVASYFGSAGNYPSYFTAIGVADGTTVDFTVPQATAGGAGVPALAAGQGTQISFDRWDVLNVVVAQQNGGDLSGTVIMADEPITVVGANECGNVPQYPTTFCDHLEEVLLPLEYWGETYVGAHAPQRGNETFHWRVYSGDMGVTIDTNPPQAGFPVTLDQGEYYQFATQQSFIFTADGPFMPVQYLEGQDAGAGTGDPSMYQMVPVEQFLTSYAFVTGENYTEHYAQIIRPANGADVTVDGVVVTGYTQVGNFEVADWPISEGAHFATSAQAFGIIQVGYTSVTSYAYPGGLRLEVINPT